MSKRRRKPKKDGYKPVSHKDTIGLITALVNLLAALVLLYKANS